MQFLPEHRSRRSSAQQTIIPRFYQTAKRCPCHARLEIWPTKPLILRHREALPVLLRARNRETAALCWDLLTTADPPQRHLLRAHLQGRYLDGGNTIPLNHRPSERHHPQVFSLRYYNFVIISGNKSFIIRKYFIVLFPPLQQRRSALERRPVVKEGKVLRSASFVSVTWSGKALLGVG